jgi:hypothetical protein
MGSQRNTKYESHFCPEGIYRISNLKFYFARLLVRSQSSEHKGEESKKPPLHYKVILNQVKGYSNNKPALVQICSPD